MAYAYGGSLYNSGSQALAVCVQDWLSAGGNNDDAYMRKALAENTDEQLADELILGFGLDAQPDAQPFAAEFGDDDERQTTLEQWECDRADVVRAMGDLREEILAAPVEADEGEEEGEDA